MTELQQHELKKKRRKWSRSDGNNVRFLPVTALYHILNVPIQNPCMHIEVHVRYMCAYRGTCMHIEVHVWYMCAYRGTCVHIEVHVYMYMCMNSLLNPRH